MNRSLLRKEDPVGGDSIADLPAPRAAGGRQRHRAARAVVLGLLGRMREGAVIVREGSRRRLCGRPVAGEAVPELEVHSAELWHLVLSEGSAGLGRAYFEGHFDTPSLDELTTLLRVIARNVDVLERATHVPIRLRRPGRGRLGEEHPGNRVVDRRNIHRHYDLGNEFFSLLLDETMTYSCALFDGPESSLREAQVEKLDRLCRKLAISPADEVLEIGTGWGSFAIHAAGRYGCRVTTTTISARQFELASARVRDAGLDRLVTVLADDYRDLSGAYDKVVSIEMIEALDWRQFDTFFATCSRLLRADGLLGLQAIVMSDQRYERAKRSEDFIKRYVFPGSCLPSVRTMVDATARVTDLQLVALDDIGLHYAETLRRWRGQLDTAVQRLEGAAADPAFQRLVEFYLCYCEAGFAERRIGDVQCLFAKPRWRPQGLAPPAG